LQGKEGEFGGNVSDGSIGKEHTLIDISTLFIQICGRIAGVGS